MSRHATIGLYYTILQATQGGQNRGLDMVGRCGEMEGVRIGMSSTSVVRDIVRVNTSVSEEVIPLAADDVGGRRLGHIVECEMCSSSLR